MKDLDCLARNIRHSNNIINIDIKNKAKGTTILTDKIKQEFDEEQLALWALNILNVMSYSKNTYYIASNLLATLPNTSKIRRQLFFIIGSSLYYMGRYKKSVAYYKGCISMTDNIVDRIACQYSIFESQRTGLYVMATLLTYLSAGVSQYLHRHQLTKTETLNLLILKLNSLDGLYSALLRYLVFLKPIFNKSRRKLRIKIAHLAEMLGNIGVRKLMISDHIFDSKLDEIEVIREISTFRQLGKFFEEIVTFRRYFEWRMRKGLVNKADCSKLVIYQEECLRRGILPEVVKISLLLDDIDTFYVNIQNCEYSFYGQRLLFRNWSSQAKKGLVH